MRLPCSPVYSNNRLNDDVLFSLRLSEGFPGQMPLAFMQCNIPSEETKSTPEITYVDVGLGEGQGSRTD